jgi:molecular chaperone GrpE
MLAARRVLARTAAARSVPPPLLARAAAVSPQLQLLGGSFPTARSHMSTDSKDGAAASAEAKAEPAAESEAAAADAAAEPSEGAEAESEVSELDALKAEVEDLKAQVTAKHDQTLRALAEAENARRRASIDVENAHKFAVGKFAKSLLDVADTLGRAAESVPEEMRDSDEHSVLKSLYEGVTMTEKMMIKTFEEHGLKRVWPIDEKFDPNLHNALFEMPDPTKDPGTVAHVASAGYVLHDRVIRAAGVGVVKAP